eukprot:scaffold35899_cov66-Phaeocystis_antarctica.AAC.3
MRTRRNILSSLQLDEVLTHRPIVVAILTTVRKRRVVRRALWYVEPGHVVVHVDRVEQAGRAVRVRAEQPAWLRGEGIVGSER